MSKVLNEVVGKVEYDNLFYSNNVPAIANGVIVASGQGELKRGTLLAKTADNKMIVLGSAEGTADCVLTDDIDATDADVETTAYIQGNFNINALIVADEYTITEADKDALRTKNILLGNTLG